MSNKLKIPGVPCDYTLWLARSIRGRNKKYSLPISERWVNNGRKTFGFCFNKIATKMNRLGYKPKVQSYHTDNPFSAGLGIGNRTVNLPLKPYR